jgi:hypothetical protein
MRLGVMIGAESADRTRKLVATPDPRMIAPLPQVLR